MTTNENIRCSECDRRQYFLDEAIETLKDIRKAHCHKKCSPIGNEHDTSCSELADIIYNLMEGGAP